MHPWVWIAASNSGQATWAVVSPPSPLIRFFTVRGAEGSHKVSSETTRSPVPREEAAVCCTWSQAGATLSTRGSPEMGSSQNWWRKASQSNFHFSATFCTDTCASQTVAPSEVWILEVLYAWLHAFERYCGSLAQGVRNLEALVFNIALSCPTYKRHNILKKKCVFYFFNT